MDSSLADSVAAAVVSRLRPELQSIERKLEILAMRVQLGSERKSPYKPTHSMLDSSKLVVGKVRKPSAKSRHSWDAPTDELEQLGLHNMRRFEVGDEGSASESSSEDHIARTLQPEPPWMNHVELAFLTYYTVEVVAKLFVHRWWFFFAGGEWAWNVFDLTVVVLGIVQVLLDKFTDTKHLDLTFLRVCRILRISKILRIFKAVRFFSELRLMANCLVGSLGNLFWATLFFLITLMMVSLVFVQGMANFQIEQPAAASGNKEQIHEMFGSVLHTMVLLFMCVTGGVNWSEVYDVMMGTGPVNTVSFLAFIIFFFFAFMNIVMSMFVDKAMKLALPDESELMVERREELMVTAKELGELIRELDKDNSGTLSQSELEAAMHVERIRFKFEMLGITVREAQVFFSTLVAATSVNELGIDEFVDACMRFKGPASGIDVQAVAFQIRHMKQSMEVQQTVVPPPDTQQQEALLGI